MTLTPRSLQTGRFQTEGIPWVKVFHSSPQHTVNSKQVCWPLELLHPVTYPHSNLGHLSLAPPSARHSDQEVPSLLRGCHIPPALRDGCPRNYESPPPPSSQSLSSRLSFQVSLMVGTASFLILASLPWHLELGSAFSDGQVLFWTQSPLNSQF